MSHTIIHIILQIPPFYVYVCVVLGTEPKALYILAKHFTTELATSLTLTPCFWFFKDIP